MALSRPLCALLCAAVMALCVSVVCGNDGNDSVYRWDRQSLPLLLDTHTQLLNTSSCTGQENEEKGWKNTLCGAGRQGCLPPKDQTEQERILGYETMYANGTRTHTDVSLQGVTTSAELPALSGSHYRRKRQVYGADARFVISDSHFITKYPFSTAVRLSSGCSGVLVSPKHVLTAAHCVHDGGDYLESTRRLKVGVLQLKTKRRRGGRGGGRRRGARLRGGKRGDGEMGQEKGEEQLMEEGQKQNSIDGIVARGRNGGRGRRRRGGRSKGHVEREGGRRNGLGRDRRSVEARKEPVFRWTRVKRTQIPQGWIHSESSTSSVSPDYDYALLELKRAVTQKHMKLGVAPSAAPLARIHFSGYDADKSLLDGRGDEKVVYRFCSVARETDELMYQRCDARPGATGAGVYIRRRQEAGGEGGKGKWQRRVIGVFSGHQWVEEEEGGELRDFNVAVRITAPKYAQICHWIHGDPGLCKDI